MTVAALRVMQRASHAVQHDPLKAQAAYYVATGVWPMVHLRSFMALTGRKRDTWLVESFGAMVTTLGLAIYPRRSSVERRAQERLAIGIAATLAACDGYFVARRRISPIYLADAAVELLLCAAVVRRAPPK